MNIDKTIAELELKHLIESLLELDIKDKQVMTMHGMPLANDLIIKDWTGKNIRRFMELLDYLGISSPSFCCIPLWTKQVWTKSFDGEMPVLTAYCFKLENGKTMMSELKLTKNEELAVLDRSDCSMPSLYEFFTMLHVAINRNLMLNRSKILEQHLFMKKILQMFNNC